MAHLDGSLLHTDSLSIKDVIDSAAAYNHNDLCLNNDVRAHLTEVNKLKARLEVLNEDYVPLNDEFINASDAKRVAE